MTCEEILNGLNPQQKEAVSTIYGPVLVLAGAGTGKTKVITNRIAYMIASGIPAESILGMTFTNKAAAEMRERLALLVPKRQAQAVTLGTFHSFCGLLLRKYITKLGYMSNYTIADESDQQGIFKQALGNICSGTPGVTYTLAQTVIGRWKNQLITPQKAHSIAENHIEAIIADLYEEYQKLLEIQNLIDFDDMLLLVWRLFTEFPEILEKCRQRYKFLLVDEYQDTNAAQFTLVKMIAGDDCNLCVVGDDDQSIYSWRGADVENILDFPFIFKGTKEIRLEQNYRSTGSILNCANAIVASSNSRRHQKSLWSALGAGKIPVISKEESAEKEAQLIVKLIRQIKSKTNANFKDFAVLFRSNQLSRLIETTLHSSGIPFTLFGGQEFFQRREIKDALSYLKLLVNPLDDQSFLRILIAPPRGIGDKAIEEFKKRRSLDSKSMFSGLTDEEFLKTLPAVAVNPARQLGEFFLEGEKLFSEPGNLAEKAEEFLKLVGYLDGLQKIYRDQKDTEKRLDNVEELFSAIKQFEEKNPGTTLQDYLETCVLREEFTREKNEDPNRDAVTLSTVHASKGLEFPIVFLIALEEGIFPHERAMKENSLEEERRLFYVAVTRAKKELYILRSRSRMVKGVNRPTKPSQFLHVLNASLADTKEPSQLIEKASSEEIKRTLQAYLDSIKRNS